MFIMGRSGVEEESEATAAEPNRPQVLLTTMPNKSKMEVATAQCLSIWPTELTEPEDEDDDPLKPPMAEQNLASG